MVCFTNTTVNRQFLKRSGTTGLFSATLSKLPPRQAHSPQERHSLSIHWLWRSQITGLRWIWEELKVQSSSWTALLSSVSEKTNLKLMATFFWLLLLPLLTNSKRRQLASVEWRLLAHNSSSPTDEALCLLSTVLWAFTTKLRTSLQLTTGCTLSRTRTLVLLFYKLSTRPLR